MSLAGPIVRHNEVSSATADPTRVLPYQPALDGLRALAVIAVIAFHSDFGWAAGGYLGVSVFFTLSGYLITTLLLAEHDTAQGIALGRFYARRLRRLLPASLMTLAAVALLARGGVFESVPDLGARIRWSAVNLANWDQQQTDTSYAAIFAGGPGSQSPVQHFWSLAIEEQFYLLAPLALVGLLRWSKGAHRRLIAAAIALYLATVGLSFLIAGALGPDAAYLHTAARSGELVAGVLVAVVLHRRAVSDRWAVLTPIAGGGLVAAMLLTGSSTQSWPYHGGLPLFALLTAALLTGLQAPGHAKPMRIKSVLSAPVLTSVGAVSYGLYLVHWPVFVWLTADRLGVDGIALHVTRLAIVVALATASYVLVERPIRRSSVGVATTLGLSVVAIAVVVMSTFSIPPPTTPFGDVADVDIQKAAAVAIAASPPVRPTPSASPVIPATVEDRPSTAVVVSAAEQPLRVLVVGDSTAVALGSGLVDHAFDQGGMQVSVAAHGGCGLVSGGRYRSEVSNAAMDMNCRDVFERQIPAILANATPDVVVVMITLADTWERSWDNSGEWLSPTDSEYAARIEDAYITFVTGMVEQGVEQIVWMRPPVSSYASDGTTVEIDSSFLDGGQEVIERVVEAQRIERPDVVSTLDLRAWFEASGLADDPASRPDGTHLSPDAAATVVEDWLVAELAALS